MRRVLTWVSAYSLALSCCTVAMSAGPLAVQGAKIITISGETIPSGTILMQDGKIIAVGADVKIPGEAKVIDGSGKVVMPGIVDAHSARGMSQANEQNSLVPFLSVVDSIDPNSDYFEECRRNGVTTAAVVPGNSTLIGGKAAIVTTAGQYVNDMLLRRDSALKLSLRPTSGSRMNQLARLRKELDKAQKALAKEAEEKEDADSQEADSKASETSTQDDAKSGDAQDKKDAESDADEGSDAEKKDAADEKPNAAEDEGLAALKAAVSGEMPVYIYCDIAMDVAAALKLSQDYQLDTIYVLGQDCHKAAKLLAGNQRPVILDPTLVYWETDPRTREDSKIVVPEIMDAADVSYIFQTDDPGSRRTIGSSYFWFQAATAIKSGLDEADALRAITLAPAELLGIDALVGSIEVGKDANLMILTGEPLDISTWVEHTIVGGEVVYQRSEDEKLERLLSPAAE